MRCEICGLPVSPLEGVRCSSCGKIVCARHRRGSECEECYVQRAPKEIVLHIVV